MLTGEVTAVLGQALCQRIGEERYGLWFENKTKLILEPGMLRVGVPNHFYQEWLDKTFSAELRDVAVDVVGADVLGFARLIRNSSAPPVSARPAQKRRVRHAVDACPEHQPVPEVQARGFKQDTDEAFSPPRRFRHRTL